MLGNGDGTFQTQLVFPVGTYPVFVATGDFNADGNLDLAVGNAFCIEGPCPPGTVSVLFGNGDGTFQPRVDYLFGLFPYAPATADLNGDGGADLAVANGYSNTVGILLNLPVISVFPNAVNFGNEKVGDKSSPQVITIGNPSGTPITIDSLTITGADKRDFAETNNCPVSPSTLAPGATCTVNVTFTPTAKGKRAAGISVKDSVSGSPQSVSMEGKGI